MKALKILTCVFALIIGLCGSFVLMNYLNLPDSYEIPQTTEGLSGATEGGDIDVDMVKSNDLSIHFMELGNKYTGDSTFIKAGDIEMLIDAGSKSSSIQTISNYINQYCTDGKLEYVVVTHAHEDHYAGFATPQNTQSIFDIYEIGTIIEFAKTNKSETATMQANYIRERDEAVTNYGAKVYNALECVNAGTTGTWIDSHANRTYNLTTDISFSILYQDYYEQNSTTENDYSVCLMLNQTTLSGDKHYLFTGDLEANGEKSLVNSSRNAGYLYEVDIYKAGHHGSKTSSSKELLEVIRPKVVCVCCCCGSSEYTSKNENQFPTQIFIDNVAQYANTDKVYVTTLCVDYKSAQFTSMNGNIIVTCNSDSTDITLSFSASAKKLKEFDWFKQNRQKPSNW